MARWSDLKNQAKTIFKMQASDPHLGEPFDHIFNLIEFCLDGVELFINLQQKSLLLDVTLCFVLDTFFFLLISCTVCTEGVHNCSHKEVHNHKGGDHDEDHKENP